MDREVNEIEKCTSHLVHLLVTAKHTQQLSQRVSAFLEQVLDESLRVSPKASGSILSGLENALDDFQLRMAVYAATIEEDESGEFGQVAGPTAENFVDDLPTNEDIAAIQIATSGNARLNTLAEQPDEVISTAPHASEDIDQRSISIEKTPEGFQPSENDDRVANRPQQGQQASPRHAKDDTAAKAQDGGIFQENPSKDKHNLGVHPPQDSEQNHSRDRGSGYSTSIQQASSPANINGAVERTQNIQSALRNGGYVESTSDPSEEPSEGEEDDIRYEKQDGILCLLPTHAQCRSIEHLIRFARGLGADEDGVAKVLMPQGNACRLLSAAAHRGKVWQNHFTVKPKEDGTSELAREERRAYLTLEKEAVSPESSVNELVQRFEALLKSPGGFKPVCYYVDLDAREEHERRRIGLPLDSPIFPLTGSRLSETRKSIRGIHSPYAYVSGKAFGAPFAMHVEDCRLISINYLYAGEKIWFALAPEHAGLLEQRLETSGRKNPCSQFLRHSARYVPRSLLEEWGIPYKIVRQACNEIVITMPGAYHQGFSTGFTCAEAVNYAGEDWNMNGYRFCNIRSRCPSRSISATMMAPLREGELQQDLEERESDGEGAEEEEEVEEDEGKEGYGRRRLKRKIAGLDGSKNNRRQEFAVKRKPKREVFSERAEKRRVTMAELASNVKKSDLPSNLIKPEQILEELNHTDADATTKNALIWLFYQVGSPSAFVQLQEVFSAARSRAGMSATIHTSTPTQAILALDILDMKDFASLILRRNHLASLAKYRREAEATHKNQMPTRRRDRRPTGRFTTLILEDLMAQAYPSLPKDDRTYQRRYKSLQNRISGGHNWDILTERFGYGILALVPVSDKFPNSLIERTADPVFRRFVSYLNDYRGDFLRQASKLIAIHLPDIISGRERSRKYRFEKEGGDLLQETIDSPRLIELCSLDDC